MATQKNTSKKPSTKKPAAKKPASKKPASKKPAAKKNAPAKSAPKKAPFAINSKTVTKVTPGEKSHFASTEKLLNEVATIKIDVTPKKKSFWSRLFGNWR